MNDKVWYSDSFLISKELVNKLDEYEKETQKDSTELIVELLHEYFFLKEQNKKLKTVSKYEKVLNPTNEEDFKLIQDYINYLNKK